MKFWSWFFAIMAVVTVFVFGYLIFVALAGDPVTVQEKIEQYSLQIFAFLTGLWCVGTFVILSIVCEDIKIIVCSDNYN